uniref:Uncharacterized protein n=1 Tax=Anopheles culicifacies TaxID=139723 RepID=A0A182LYK1_9DIPT
MKRLIDVLILAAAGTKEQIGGRGDKDVGLRTGAELRFESNSGRYPLRRTDYPVAGTFKSRKSEIVDQDLSKLIHFETLCHWTYVHELSTTQKITPPYMSTCAFECAVWLV